jgi:chemotaxis receptor (MCP) glutamine deamidase CheD
MPRKSTRVAIHVGEMHAAATPTLIRTLLGSCIATCLYDPIARVGGMNHFMLPRARGQSDDLARFGVHAMEELVFRMQNLGADRRRLRGKVFGGGHVLATPDAADSVSRQNVRFIEEFMAVEGIPVVSRDLGGRAGRIVLFATDTGKAFVRRVGALPELLRTEQTIQRSPPEAPRYGEVTLFDD